MDHLRIYVSIAIGCFLMLSLAVYAWNQGLILLRKPWSFRSLLKGFRAKMWMTIGLGLVFFSLYGVVVWIGSHLIDAKMGEQLFSLARRTPIYFIYAGLLTFSVFSLSIYFVRMVIKYLYLTRGRGD